LDSSTTQAISLSANPALFWLFVIGNSLVALSFCSILAGVVFVLAKRRDFVFNWQFMLFAAFLLVCGAAHLVKVWAMLQTNYWLEGSFDAVAGVVSTLAAILLWTLIPKALTIPDFGQMLAAYGSIDKHINLRERAEDKFQALLDSAPDAMVIVNQEGQIRITNSQAEALFGYAPGELTEKNAESLIAPRSRKGHKMSKIGVFAYTPENALTSEEELFALAKDGREFPIEMRLSPLETEEGSLVASAIRDVSKNKQLERNVSLQYIVGKALNESQTFKDITKNLLKTTGEEMGWASGSYWVVDEISNVLRCVDVWSLPKHRDTSFAQQTKRITFAPGIGLPGRVWANNDSLWIEDVRKDTNFPRASAAWESGLGSGIAFPIATGDKVFGVCEFFAEGVQTVDEGMHRTLNTFGRQIGQFVARQQMQSALQQTEERLTIFTSSVIEYAIIMLDAKGLIDSWNSGAQRIYGYDSAEVNGKPFATFLSQKDSESGKLQILLDQAKDDGQIKDVGWRLRKDGSRFYAEILFTALKDDKGQLRGFATVTHELTEPVKGSENERKAISS